MQEIDCAGEPLARGGRFYSRPEPSSVYNWKNNFVQAGKMSSFIESYY